MNHLLHNSSTKKREETLFTLWARFGPPAYISGDFFKKIFYVDVGIKHDDATALFLFRPKTIFRRRIERVWSRLLGDCCWLLFDVKSVAMDSIGGGAAVET